MTCYACAGHSVARSPTGFLMCAEHLRRPTRGDQLDHPFRPHPREPASNWVRVSPTQEFRVDYVSRIHEGVAHLSDGTSVALSDEYLTAALLAVDH